MRYVFFFCILSLCACKNDQVKSFTTLEVIQEKHILINPEGQTLKDRFLPPTGARRLKSKSNSFSSYLRDLKLKDIDDLVHYYNGDSKPKANTYVSVFDLKIGDKDLHQCADGIIRLHAEYLWKQEKYTDIYYNFTNGFKVEYTKWMDGNRMEITGNKTKWEKIKSPSNTYDDLWQYLELIFTYAGTASLSKELASIDFADMKIGDVLIQGGHPGHAVLIIDMAIDTTTGKKYFMLGQSYMPAQDFQILANNSNSKISPWYELDTANPIVTPEWTFYKSDLKRFYR